MDEREQEAYLAFLRERREELLSRIKGAAQRAGRDANEVELLAVSKTVDMPEVALAARVGYTCFGENRPQELKRKVALSAGYPELASVRFDMIGNLQRNKINQVLGNATLVHSVSSLHLAEGLSTRAQARGITCRCLIEVNVSGEASKAGMTPEEAREVAEAIAELPALTLEGCMCMAPARDLDAARRAFAGLRELRDALKVQTGLALPVLSCGMSGDFEVAVEEGSTIVRLGRIVFDEAYGTGT